MTTLLAPQPAPLAASIDVSQRRPTAQRDELYAKYETRLKHNRSLDRAAVSYQANRQAPFYRWFKYREGFSEALVKYVLAETGHEPGKLLDPFVGAGASMFAASDMGWATTGVEILPVGVYAIKARLAARNVNPARLLAAIRTVQLDGPREPYPHLRITDGAFPPAEEEALSSYLAHVRTTVDDDDTRTLLEYAAFCVLEEISYTRKDGQYLRWDHRSGRARTSKIFDKGRIVPFEQAVTRKLDQIIVDLSQDTWLSANNSDAGITVLEGSSLDILPTMDPSSYDFILTSPPYANRYDYTRTYALELAFLGCSEEHVKELRQAMLSCTVENRYKDDAIAGAYARRGASVRHQAALDVFARQDALHEVLAILDADRKLGTLNNPSIVRLIRNYFFEMTFVLMELGRVLRPGGTMVMVNDNVRYQGEEVPVDLILSNIAESFGFETEVIWTLGRGKGNSSQQMGVHGRNELRKCVYVWRRRASGD